MLNAVNNVAGEVLGLKILTSIFIKCSLNLFFIILSFNHIVFPPNDNQLYFEIISTTRYQFKKKDVTTI